MINQDVGKTYYNIETNEGEITKNNSQSKTLKTAIRFKKNKSKNYPWECQSKKLQYTIKSMI